MDMIKELNDIIGNLIRLRWKENKVMKSTAEM